jgi:ATP-dependent exoDNAse (exonuclease V) beta subunit
VGDLFIDAVDEGWRWSGKHGEVPHSLQQHGGAASGQIDLLYRKGERWTIVEFKTDEVRSRAGFERLLREKDYVAQARRYAAAAEQLLGTRPRCFLCMLDYRGSIDVHSVPEDGPPERVAK